MPLMSHFLYWSNIDFFSNFTKLTIILLLYKIGIHVDSHFLNNVFVAANKPNTKNGFILYSPDSPPLETVFDFLSTLGLIKKIKNIKQNKRENIVRVSFNKRALIFFA